MSVLLEPRFLPQVILALTIRANTLFILFIAYYHSLKALTVVVTELLLFIFAYPKYLICYRFATPHLKKKISTHWLTVKEPF